MKIYSSLPPSALSTPALWAGQQYPVKSLNGLITGYSSTGTGIPSYGAPPQPIKSTGVKPQQNSAGQWINTSTGQPYHGAYTDESGRPSYYSNGKMVGSAADVGIENQDFSVTRTPKNPTISGAVDQLQTQSGAAGNLLSKSVGDYLAEAGRVNAQSKDQLAIDQKAYDTSQTENRLNNDAATQADALLANNRTYETGQNNVLKSVGDASRSYQTGVADSLAGLERGTQLTADELRRNNADYATNQNRIQGDVASQTRDYTTGEQSRLDALNQNAATTDANLRKNNATYQGSQRAVQDEVAANNKVYANTVAGRLQKLRDDLTTTNADYETKAQAVADQAYQVAKRGNDLYHLTSGTPTSGSGNMDNRAIRAYADINTPLQRELADRRYGQVNQLDAANASADQANYSNLMSQYAGESAMNSDFANRGTSLEQYLSDLYGRNYNAGEASGRNVYGANMAVDSSASALQADLANRGVSLSQYLQGLGGQNYAAENAALSSTNQSQLALAQAQSGVNTDVANRNADTTKYLSTNDQQTAQYIQGLRQQTAGMSRAAAAQYLQQLAVPAEVAQQILSGQIANQGAIQSLDERANAYTFNTPYDTSRVPASPGFRVNAPRSYAPQSPSAPANSGSVLSRNYDTATTQAPSSDQVGGKGANGWVLGSDGNYYVPDSTAPNGYRLVWRKPAAPSGAYPAPATDNRGTGYMTSGGYAVGRDGNFSYTYEP